MNIDELARSAAAEARGAAAERVDAATMLSPLYRTRRNRSVASIVAIVVVALSALIGTLVARAGGDSAAPPAVSPHTSCTHAKCPTLHHVVLTVPVTFTLPHTFQNGFEQKSLACFRGVPRRR